MDPGTTASFTVTIANQDSTACGWTYFALASTLPQGWATSDPRQQGLWLGPGETGTLTLSKSVPAGTVLGGHPVDVRVLRDNVEGSATATTTVECKPVAPPPRPRRAATWWTRRRVARAWWRPAPRPRPW